MSRQFWSQRRILAALLTLSIVGSLFVVTFELWVPPFGDELWKWLHATRAAFGFSKLSWETLFGTVGKISFVLGGAISFFRYWYFAEAQLPERLKDYLEKAIRAELEHREVVLAAVRQHIESTPLKPISATSDAVAKHRATFKTAVRDLDGQLSDPSGMLKALGDKFVIAAKNYRRISASKATLHLERGMFYAHLAASGQDVVATQKKALDEYKSATELDPNDFTLHRAYLELAELSGESAGLTDIADSWLRAAQSARAWREAGDAHHKLAQIHAGRSDDVSLTVMDKAAHLLNAQGYAEAAVRALQNNPIPGRSANSDPNLAECLELAGDIRVARRNLTRAVAHFQNALTIYRALRDGASIPRILQKLVALGVANADGMGGNASTTEVGLIEAYCQLGRTQIALGEKIAAQSTLLNARRRLTDLTGIADVLRNDLQNIITDLLSKASIVSPAPQTPQMIPVP